uniref:Uroplakin 3B n=1 Tax=Nothoprocta perdicaria TaxID=30464 RepID=A0A8C6YLH1_NOTPE
MELPRLLLLLALGTGRAVGLGERAGGAAGSGGSPPPPPTATQLPYVPRAPPQPLAGRVTATTFALDKPFCVFDGHVRASDSVWLAVTFANATAAFRNPPSAAAIPPYGRLRAALAYMTLEAPAGAYACPARSPGVLRVGSDTTCGAQRGPAACNGPLPSPGPYRVKFLVLGPRGPVAETQWSEPVGLRQAHMVPVTPSGRSAGMIVLTSILSILFAVLLACLVALLVTCSSVFSTKADAVSVRRYNTHHVYDQPAARL